MCTINSEHLIFIDKTFLISVRPDRRCSVNFHSIINFGHALLMCLRFMFPFLILHSDTDSGLTVS